MYFYILTEDVKKKKQLIRITRGGGKLKEKQKKRYKLHLMILSLILVSFFLCLPKKAECFPKIIKISEEVIIGKGFGLSIQLG